MVAVTIEGAVTAWARCRECNRTRCPYGHDVVPVWTRGVSSYNPAEHQVQVCVHPAGCQRRFDAMVELADLAGWQPNGSRARELATTWAGRIDASGNWHDLQARMTMQVFNHLRPSSTSPEVIPPRDVPQPGAPVRVMAASEPDVVAVHAEADTPGQEPDPAPVSAVPTPVAQRPAQGSDSVIGSFLAQLEAADRAFDPEVALARHLAAEAGRSVGDTKQ